MIIEMRRVEIMVLKKRLVMPILISVVLGSLTLSLCAFSSSGGVYYEYNVTFVYYGGENTSKTVNIGPQDLKLILVPSIEGWQQPVNYTLYVNGKALSPQIVIDDDGNRVINVEDPLTIPPNGTLKITLLQTVYVESPPPFGSRKRYDRLVVDIDTSREETYVSGFWSDDANHTLENLANQLWKYSGEDPEKYVLEVIKWVVTNIEYDKISTAPPARPVDVIKLKRGACGERAALVSALLRYKGIPSYLYIALYYDENIYANISSRVIYEDAGLHVFSFVINNEGGFVIDTTLPLTKPEIPQSAITQPLVNTGDNIIIIGRFVGAKNTTLSDYLEVYSDKYIVTLRRLSVKGYDNLGFLISTSTAITALIIIIFLYARALKFT